MRYGGVSVNPRQLFSRQRVKPLAGPPDDLWVDEEDMYEGKNSRHG